MEKTNPVLKKTIRKLEEKGRKKDIDIWKEAAERLKRSERKKNPVNLSKIKRHVENGSTILVPGKVTAYGSLEKDIKVAAFSFSSDAKKELEENGEAISILDLLEENPEGEEVRLMEG